MPRLPRCSDKRATTPWSPELPRAQAVRPQHQRCGATPRALTAFLAFIAVVAVAICASQQCDERPCGPRFIVRLDGPRGAAWEHQSHAACCTHGQQPAAPRWRYDHMPAHARGSPGVGASVGMLRGSSGVGAALVGASVGAAVGASVAALVGASVGVVVVAAADEHTVIVQACATTIWHQRKTQFCGHFAHAHQGHAHTHTHTQS